MITETTAPPAAALRRIGTTDVRVTALGLDGGPIGGLFTPVPHDQATPRTVFAAVGSRSAGPCARLAD